MGRTGDSLVMNSPHEVGEEALSKRSPLSGDSVPPSWVKMVVVVVVEPYNFFKKILLSEVDHVRTFSLGTCSHFNKL